MFSATSSCTTNGHPVVLSFERDKTIKVTYESLIMDAMFVLPGIFLRFNLLEFPVRETNARRYYLAETIV